MGHLIYCSNEICKRAPSIKISHINPSDHNLFIAIVHKSLHLSQNLINGSRSGPAAHVRDNTISTKGIAPILHFDKSSGMGFKGLDIELRVMGLIGQDGLDERLFFLIR